MCMPGFIILAEVKQDEMYWTTTSVSFLSIWSRNCSWWLPYLLRRCRSHNISSSCQDVLLQVVHGVFAIGERFTLRDHICWRVYLGNKSHVLRLDPYRIPLASISIGHQTFEQFFFFIYIHPNSTVSCTTACFPLWRRCFPFGFYLSRRLHQRVSAVTREAMKTLFPKRKTWKIYLFKKGSIFQVSCHDNCFPLTTFIMYIYFRNFWLGWDGWVPTCVSLFSPVAMGVWAMELNLEATGGASDFSRQAELDSSQLNFDLESWDDGYVDLERNSQPHFGADSEHYSPSVSEPAESHVALQLSQYRDYNFQNSLRDAAFNNSTTLPDLPWESSLWKCIFDDEYDPLDAINPEKPLTGPSPPFVPRDGDELKDALIEKKRSLLPLDKKLPIYTVAVGHRRDISWEDKREADFQRGLKKWTSIVLSWPEEWSVCKAMQECESLVQVCEQLGHYFVGKAPATLIKRANSMIYIMEQGHKLGYIFPYTEQDLYALLKVLKNTGQTASRLKGVMETLTFCRYIFNIEDLQTLTVSKRCYGAISGGPVNRANQAAPLSVRDVRRYLGWHDGRGYFVLHLFTCSMEWLCTLWQVEAW